MLPPQATTSSREQLAPKDHPLARMIEAALARRRAAAPANQARLVQALLGPMLVHGNGVTEIEVIGGEE